MKLILASSSIGRKKILKRLGLKFEIVPANINEEKITAANPINLVKKIAKAKAVATLRGLTSGEVKPPKENYLIIAADSLIVFNGKTYGKPKTKKEAKRILQRLSGKTHEFITGLCLLDTSTSKLYQGSCRTKLIFEKFSKKEINQYVRIANVTSYAGGYSLEEKGSEILRPKIRVIGSESNVLGLALEKLIPILRKNQINIPKSPQDEKLSKFLFRRPR